MKHLSLRRALALALCACLIVTLLTAFSPTRSAYAATTRAAACGNDNFAPGFFKLPNGANFRWFTCKGNFMELIMQSDNNLVLYGNANPIWASHTGNSKIPWAIVTFQTDGNLVVYPVNCSRCSGALWASHTGGRGTRLSLQDDGNMVIYNASGQALWASHTSGW